MPVFGASPLFVSSGVPNLPPRRCALLRADRVIPLRFPSWLFSLRFTALYCPFGDTLTPCCHSGRLHSLSFPRRWAEGLMALFSDIKPLKTRDLTIKQ
jgi:hypothetical protein